MKPRRLSSALQEVARYYPVVSLTGPRQSGKSTLTRGTFPELPRYSLEVPDTRSFAREDPRGFIQEIRSGAILDEVQHVPELFSYLQEEVDRDPTPGRFILTGSEHLSVSSRVAQSLAGRSGILHLLPLSLDELVSFDSAERPLVNVLWAGGYPRIFDVGIPPERWLSDYTANYIQRDVRQLLNISDLDAFSAFLKLCAGSTAQELNLARLGNDVGISSNTAKAWLSVLEASFLCFCVPAYTPNIRKQVVKRPKLHFFDSGLVCFLLGIRSPEELQHHPGRGAIFESWVASEMYKQYVHRGLSPNLWHFRRSRGPEIDLLDREARVALEIKSGATLMADVAQAVFEHVAELPETYAPRLVYGGEESRKVHGVDVCSWRELSKRFDSLTKS